MKPDVVAPGTLLTLANDDWEGAAADWDTNLSGTQLRHAARGRADGSAARSAAPRTASAPIRSW